MGIHEADATRLFSKQDLKRDKLRILKTTTTAVVGGGPKPIPVHSAGGLDQQSSILELSPSRTYIRTSI